MANLGEYEHTTEIVPIPNEVPAVEPSPSSPVEAPV